MIGVKIRPPRLEPTVKGIPRDFYQIMDYFNRALKDRRMPFIPRRVPITLEEVTSKWVPSLGTNISFVAAKNHKVIGSATVFYDQHSTAYEHSTQRPLGTVGLTVNPDYPYKFVAIKLIREIIGELIEQEKRALIITPVEFQYDEEIMKLLSRRGERATDERYKTIGLSGEVLRYHLP